MGPSRAAARCRSCSCRRPCTSSSSGSSSCSSSSSTRPGRPCTTCATLPSLVPNARLHSHALRACRALQNTHRLLCVARLHCESQHCIQFVTQRSHGKVNAAHSVAPRVAFVCGHFVVGDICVVLFAQAGMSGAGMAPGGIPRSQSASHLGFPPYGSQPGMMCFSGGMPLPPTFSNPQPWVVRGLPVMPLVLKQSSAVICAKPFPGRQNTGLGAAPFLCGGYGFGQPLKRWYKLRLQASGLWSLSGLDHRSPFAGAIPGYEQGRRRRSDARRSRQRRRRRGDDLARRLRRD